MSTPVFFAVRHEHTRECSLGHHDDLKLIGYYSTREKAEAAVERVKGAPGFRDHLDGFLIEEIEIDCKYDGWPEGFVTV